MAGEKKTATNVSLSTAQVMALIVALITILGSSISSTFFVVDRIDDTVNEHEKQALSPTIHPGAVSQTTHDAEIGSVTDKLDTVDTRLTKLEDEIGDMRVEQRSYMEDILRAVGPRAPTP